MFVAAITALSVGVFGFQDQPDVTRIKGLPATVDLDALETSFCTVKQGVALPGLSLDQSSPITSDAVAQGHAKLQDTWVVFDPEICTIRPPQIETPLTLQDAEVSAALSAIGEDATYEDPGCFLDGTALIQNLRQSRGWNDNDAFDAYITFLGASIISGELRFYSDSPLRTPPGFAVTTGACGAVLPMAKITRSHNALIDNFDAFLRENAASIPCAEGASLMSGTWHETMDRLSNGTNTNAWLPYEVQIIALASGLYEGSDYNTRGTARPPICHIP